MNRELEEAKELAHNQPKVRRYPFYNITLNENSRWKYYRTNYYFSRIKHPITFQGRKYFAITPAKCNWWQSQDRDLYTIAIPYSEEFGIYGNKIRTDSIGEEYIECLVFEMTLWLQDDFSLTPVAISPNGKKCFLYGFDKKEVEE